jgi:hypothetical protein
MANIKAQANGNWSATGTWAGGVVPVAGDAVWANGFTVTLNQDISVASLNTAAVSGISFNGGSTSALTGGTFNAGNLVANITATDITAGGNNCISVLNTNLALTITSTNINGSSTGNNVSGISYGGNGTCSINAVNINSGIVANLSGNGINAGGTATSNLTITGNAYSRNAVALNFGGAGITTFTGTLNFVSGATTGPLSISSTGTTNINADLITPSAFGFTMASVSSTIGTINFVGNVQANTSVSFVSCLNHSSTATVNVTGNCTGGAVSSNAVSNNSTGTINIYGTAIAGANGGAGANNNSTGILYVIRAKGNGYGLGSVGIVSAVGLSSNNQAAINIVRELEYGPLGMSPIGQIPVRLLPSSSNVAIFYTSTGGTKTLTDSGASADFPATSNVRLGTTYNLGNLTGTLAVPAAGSVALGVPVDNTTGTAVLTAANVQTALTSQGLTTTRAANLDNLDATITSRMASFTYTAPDNASITAIKAKTDNLPAAPAAVSDIPTAVTNASAVRANLAAELARIDVATSTRSTLTAAQVQAAVIPIL